MNERELQKKNAARGDFAADTPPATSMRSQSSAELAGLTYAEQVERVKPPKPTPAGGGVGAGIVQKQEMMGPPAPPPKSGGYTDAIKKVAQAWLKTETGKLIVDKAKEFAFSNEGLPFTITMGTAALAAMVANEMDIPVGSLDIDVKLGTTGGHEFKLNFKPLWKGPLTGPEEYGGMVTLKITEFIKRDSGTEPGKVARDRELFVFSGMVLEAGGGPPKSNHAVILVDSANRPVRRCMVYPGGGSYDLDWWANPWEDGQYFKLVVIPGAGGPTKFQKFQLPVNLKDYYIKGRHPHTIDNIIQLEELGGGKQTMYFDYPP